MPATADASGETDTGLPTRPPMPQAAPDATATASRETHIGRLSLRLNEPRVAVVWLHRAAASRDDDLSVLASLADAQLRSGDHDGAQVTIQQALAREPENPTFLALARRSR